MFVVSCFFQIIIQTLHLVQEYYSQFSLTFDAQGFVSCATSIVRGKHVKRIGERWENSHSICAPIRSSFTNGRDIGAGAFSKSLYKNATWNHVGVVNSQL